MGFFFAITSIEFLESYPLIVISDAGGHIWLCAVRPSVYRHRCLLLFSNETNSENTTRFQADSVLNDSVRSLVWLGVHAHQLLSADEAGYFMLHFLFANVSSLNYS